MKITLLMRFIKCRKIARCSLGYIGMGLLTSSPNKWYGAIVGEITQSEISFNIASSKVEMFGPQFLPVDANAMLVPTKLLHQRLELNILARSEKPVEPAQNSTLAASTPPTPTPDHQNQQT